MSEDQLADTFPLPSHMRAAIVAHAQRDAPRECCGLISGKTGHPVRLHETHNIALGNRLYEIDPSQLIDLEFRDLPEHDEEIIAIYHSHPASPAYPSATDLELAFWPDAIYLICSLVDPAQPVVRGFRLRGGSVTEVALPE